MCTEGEQSGSSRNLQLKGSESQFLSFLFCQCLVCLHSDHFSTSTLYHLLHVFLYFEQFLLPTHIPYSFTISGSSFSSHLFYQNQETCLFTSFVVSCAVCFLYFLYPYLVVLLFLKVLVFVHLIITTFDLVFLLLLFHFSSEFINLFVCSFFFST